MKQPIHTTIDTYERDEVRQVAVDYLIELLHKIALSSAAKELRLNVPTLARIIDDKLPLQSVTYLTAAYIVFMFETNLRIQRIMELQPRGTAYYTRTGDVRNGAAK